MRPVPVPPRFAAEPASCPLCDGSGWKPLDASRNPRMVRCDCWLAATVAWNLEHSGIPPKYRHVTLEENKPNGFTVVPDNEQMVRALRVTQRFVDRWPAPIHDDGKHSLCFIGKFGIGKTHLAAAALRAVIQKGARGLFCKQTELLSLIRQTYAPDAEVSERDVLRPAKMADVLVLDDVGIDNPTDFVTLKLYELLEDRINHRRATILTTNFENTGDPTDMRSLEIRVTGIIHSRLTEVCEFVEYTAGDYRHLERNGGTIADLKALWHRTMERTRQLVAGPKPIVTSRPARRPEQPEMPDFWTPRITNDPKERK